MNSSPHQSNSPDENDFRVGLIANGRAGAWEVSVDETTSGVVRWFVQIEGPSLYLYFEITSPGVIAEWIKFFESSKTLSIETRKCIEVGSFNSTLVIMRRDNEYPDRYFLCIGEEGRAMAQISIVGDDFKALSSAVHDLGDELNSEGD